MVVGEIPVDVDVAVLGGGWAGTAAALAAAQQGKQVVLVDAHGPGGRSFQEIYGPLRALQAAVEPVWRLGSPPFTALHLGPIQLDWTALRGWVQASVREQVRRTAARLEEAGVEWVHGRGSFAGERELRVESEHGLLRYHFERAVIATGAQLDIHILHEGKFLTPTDLLTLETLPEGLAIQGGDELSLELAVLCAKLGVQVTLHVSAGQTLLPGWELDAQKMLRDGLAGLGVTVVAEPPDGADAATVVTGPLAPEVDGLALDAVNLRTGPEGFIHVDDRLRTSDPAIYAAGAVIGPPFHPGLAAHQGRVAGEALCDLPVVYPPQALPITVGSEPLAAKVGLSSQEAAALGYRVRLARVEAQHPSGASQTAWIVAEEGSGVLLGACLVGPGADAAITEAALAIEMGATLTDLSATVHVPGALGWLLAEAAQTPT